MVQELDQTLVTRGRNVQLFPVYPIRTERVMLRGF